MHRAHEPRVLCARLVGWDGCDRAEHFILGQRWVLPPVLVYVFSYGLWYHLSTMDGPIYGVVTVKNSSGAQSNALDCLGK